MKDGMKKVEWLKIYESDSESYDDVTINRNNNDRQKYI